MTISRKIIGGYAAILAILMLVAMSAFYALDMVQKRYGEFIDIKEQLVDGANELRVAVGDQTQHYRGLLLFPDQQQRFLGNLQEDSSHFATVLEKMKSFVAARQEYVGLDEIAKLQAETEQKLGTAIALVQS